MITEATKITKQKTIKTGFAGMKTGIITSFVMVDNDKSYMMEIASRRVPKSILTEVSICSEDKGVFIKYKVPAASNETLERSHDWATKYSKSRINQAKGLYRLEQPIKKSTFQYIENGMTFKYDSCFYVKTGPKTAKTIMTTTAGGLAVTSIFEPSTIITL